MEQHRGKKTPKLEKGSSAEVDREGHGAGK